MLTAQHQRGREVTDYIVQVTTSKESLTSHTAPLSKALTTFVRMYENHAAREDTVVFTAWKTALSSHALHELGEQFEQIERQQFGRDGFEDAVKQIGSIEKALGLADLAQFTAPPPPKA